MRLLSDVRKKVLLLWLIFSAMLLLFFLIQVQNGKYEGMETTAWLWIFVQLLPGLSLLLAANLLRFHAGKTILNWVHWSIFSLACLFLLFVLFTLLQVSAGAAGLSLEKGFTRSYGYLLPLQALLLAVFGVLFFKKESLFQPNETLLRGHAQQLLDQATEANALDRRRALEFFVAADMEGMLDFLKEKMKNNSNLNDVLLLKNNLVLLQRNTDMGRMSLEESRREYNRICIAALGLVEKVGITM